MERESFEDPAIAALLADHFVTIKVDREERPDVDAVYMEAVQALTGSGGWPLSVFLTPDLQPFFGGTYFPPERRYGMPSFREVLTAVADAWARRRGDVASDAADLVERLAGAARAEASTLDVGSAQERALKALDAQHDPRWGGFGGAPKFPSPSRLFFLIGAARADRRARGMLERTLDAMAAGGMYDWLGGGFHRYSTDEKWLVPHFEKMLYDNALLARAYGEAGLALGRPEWVRVARETADYLLREMRGPEGGFFSSTDADSEGREGAYFVWSEAEVRAALPARHGDLLVRLLDLGPAGTFETGTSVLRPVRALAEVAAEFGLTTESAAVLLDEARRGLLSARGRRVPPATDDKRLAAWNGMAAWALAWLGAALHEERYLAAARVAVGFVLAGATPEGRLTRSWRNGARSGVETLEDVAWVAAALVQLYEADGNPEWLERAGTLLDRRLPHYRTGAGQLFDTADDGPALPLRPHTPHDGATPSPAGVLAGTLLRLAALTGDDSLREVAAGAIAAESGVVSRAPEACLTLLDAAAAAGRPPVTLVIAGDPGWRSTGELLAVAWSRRPPGCALAVTPTVPAPAPAAAAVPALAGRGPAGPRRARAYLCEGGTCRLPVEEPVALARILDRASTEPGGESPAR